MAEKGFCQIDYTLGDAAFSHDICCKNEKRNADQGKFIKARDHSLNDDNKIHIREACESQSC